MSRVFKIFSKTFAFLIEEIDTIWYVIGFISTIICFGIAYTLLTPIGHGVGESLKPLPEVTLSTGIYFSVITISSLGYGDVHPVGYSKILASIEVLMGITIIGILIAKITSRRISHHVTRLFISDSRKRLEDLGIKFDNCRKILNFLSLEFEKNFVQPPWPDSEFQHRSSALDPSRKQEMKSKFQTALDDLHTASEELFDYFQAEVRQDSKYFRLIPSIVLERTGKDIVEALWALGQLISELPTRARSEILDFRNRRRISETIDLQKKTYELTKQYVNANSGLNIFREIMDTCDHIPKGYFQVPEEEQPDQLLPAVDEPQEVATEAE